jgi:hypothetical protein
MVLRSVLTAALAFAAFSSAASADDGSGHHRRITVYSSRHPLTLEQTGGIGGQEYKNRTLPYIYFQGPYSNTTHFDNQTFWERVETQPEYPIR